jgi:hypothetical protein
MTLVPALVVGLLLALSVVTKRSYETWMLPDSAGSDQSGWPLRTPGFWHGFRPVTRQQLLHTGAALALLAGVVDYPPSGQPGLRRGLLLVDALVLAVAAALTLLLGGRRGLPPSPGGGWRWQRPAGKGADVGHRWQWPERSCLGITLAGAIMLAGSLLARLWWAPHAPPHGKPRGLLPGDSGLPLLLSVAEAALLLLLLVAVITGMDRQQNHENNTTAGGFLSILVATLACLIGGMFAAGLNLWVAAIVGHVVDFNSIRPPTLITCWSHDSSTLIWSVCCP